MGITEKLVEVGQKVSYLQKGGNNSAQSYTYARAQDVFLKVNDAMHALKVACVMSTAELVNTVQGLGKSGNGVLVVVRITQTYRDAETGETATFQGLGSGVDTQDKSIMKANTAALKYLLTNAFNISWGDDPEADPVTDEEGRVTEGAKPAKKGARKPGNAAAQKALLAAIEKCTTEAELDVQKAEVLKLDNQTAEYKAARDAVGAKRALLKQTTIPGT